MINKEKQSCFFSVVVLNWNSLDCLKKCILALEAQSFRAFEVIIVDNGSSDDSVNYLQTASFDFDYKLIFNSQNEGFARGMNQGFNQANGQWLMALNVDLFLAENYLREAHRIISRNTTIDLLGAKIYRYDNGFSDEVICTAVAPTQTMSVKTDLQSRDGEYEVFGPGGCCPLFSKVALKNSALHEAQTGMFEEQYYDERYFAYGEDVDLFLRLAIQGYKCLYSSNLEAWHVHSVTQSGIRWYHKDNQTLKRLAANAVSTWIKNYPGRLMSGRLFYIGLIPIFMSAFLLLKKPKKMIWPLVGYFEILKRLKVLFKMRNLIQAKLKISLLEYKNFYK